MAHSKNLQFSQYFGVAVSAVMTGCQELLVDPVEKLMIFLLLLIFSVCGSMGNWGMCFKMEKELRKLVFDLGGNIRRNKIFKYSGVSK